MANPFDQFDSGNPFDQFDKGASEYRSSMKKGQSVDAARNEFIAREGKRGMLDQAFNPNAPIAPATGVADWATRVLPNSATQLIPKVAQGAYQAVKGQTDPIINSLANLNNQPDPNYQPAGDQMIGNAWDTVKGVGAASLSGIGFGMDGNNNVNWSLENAKNAWQTDPAMAAVGLVPVAKNAPAVTKSAVADIRQIGKGMKPETLDANISAQYQKAIRPSVGGTAGNYNQFVKSNKNAAEGVYDIVKAKDRGELKLGDEMAGQEIANRLPETVQEHLQAISQAKQNAFTKYDSMKKAAGDAGANVSLNSIAAELETAAKDPVLNDLRPETAAYLKQQAEILKTRGTYSADQAQTAIATLNKDVEAFYKNPTPDRAGKIAVDASIVKQLRSLLDEAVTQEQGPGYQALKNEYGRLTAMEKEAGHRARVAGRAAPASLMDAIGGYMGSGELVAGILSMNPALIAKGGTMLAVKNYIKKINSPDTQIKSMYKTADKHYTRNKGETP